MAALCVVIPWVGCVTKTPIRGPIPPPQQTQQIPKNTIVTHLLGVWENPGRHGKPSQVIFGSGGQMTFKGGLEFYNPGQWELDPDRQELRITLPEAADDKLQIFQLYVGQGIKAFDRTQKQITYSFNGQTWTLNVGGWEYSKAEQPPVVPESEPVLK